MGSNGAQGLLSALEAAFRAARVSEDDLAAADLAFSLAQDISLVDDLCRQGGTVLVEEGSIPIDLVGHDYLSASDWLIPLGKAIVELGGQVVPRREPTILLSRLRHLARAGATVSVGTRLAGVVGRITKCTPDHLEVRGRRHLAIPLGEVAYVRRARGGSADVL